MAYITLEDMNGSIDVIVFPQLYETAAPFLVENNVILVSGRADISEDRGSKIVSDGIRPYEQLSEASKTLWIKLPSNKDIELSDITMLLARSRGMSKTVVYDEKTNKCRTARAENYVKITDELVAQLKAVCGEGCVVVK